MSPGIDGTRMKHAVAAVLGEVVNYNGNGEALAPGAWTRAPSGTRRKRPSAPS